MFKQILSWGPEEEFIINAGEFEMIMQMAEKSEFLAQFETMISRLINQNKITVSYKDDSGKELSQDQVINILESTISEINNSSTIEPII